MKKFRLCMFVAVLLVLTSTGSTHAQLNNQKPGQSLKAASANKGKGSLEETITSMENRAWEAVKKRDAKAFSDLFAADGLVTDSDGITTRAAFLQTLPDLMISEYTLTNVKVMMIDKDSAVITYKADVKGSFKGQAFPPNPAYVSSIWTKRGGKWMCVYHQETLAR
ncbi:MAG TPA: nuclear transport factor 2 family protein [Pyrinomonadaceae bacterium]